MTAVNLIVHEGQGVDLELLGSLAGVEGEVSSHQVGRLLAGQEYQAFNRKFSVLIATLPQAARFEYREGKYQACEQQHSFCRP